MRQKNAWRVIWVEDGKKRRKHFEGAEHWAEMRGREFYEKPLDAAVAFAKELKAKDLVPELISVRKAFIQKREQLKPPNVGMTWCPYCVKWRHFNLTRLRRATYLSPAANRCPVCGISDEDYYVKKYNGKLEALSTEEIRRMHKRGTANAERSKKRGR